MTKAHRLKQRKPDANTLRALDRSIKLNFLLGCSESALGSFELARLAECDNLRRELHTVLDRLIDETAQAAVAAWFRTVDRNALKQALETPEDVMEWAQLQIARRQRTDGELIPLPPLPALPPGAAHLAAALRYHEHNIAEGKCAVCPKPLAHNSVRYCEKHLRDARLRHKPKGGKGGLPGSIDYLYDGAFESGHGRQPGTLASLAMNREKKTRALLAELGIPRETAAVSLNAAKEALIRCVPQTEDKAATLSDLLQAAQIPTRTTAQKALKQLLAAGMIQRIAGSGTGSPFRYFAAKNPRIGGSC